MGLIKNEFFIIIMINYRLPIWNGVKDVPGSTTAELNIDYSNDSGVYKQRNERIIQYEKEYEHMTPLKASKYIRKLKKDKIDWVLGFSKSYDKILEIGGGDSFNYEFFDCNQYTIVDPSINQELVLVL